MILIGYDGSDPAKHAIVTAHAITGDVAATVLHMWQPPTEYLISDLFGGMPIWTAEQMNELDAHIRERAGRLAAEGVALAKEHRFGRGARLRAGPEPPWGGGLGLG